LREVKVRKRRDEIKRRDKVMRWMQQNRGDSNEYGGMHKQMDT